MKEEEEEKQRKRLQELINNDEKTYGRSGSFNPDSGEYKSPNGALFEFKELINHMKELHGR